jgi:hypothetical protein
MDQFPSSSSSHTEVHLLEMCNSFLAAYHSTNDIIKFDFNPHRLCSGSYLSLIDSAFFLFPLSSSDFCSNLYLFCRILNS